MIGDPCFETMSICVDVVERAVHRRPALPLWSCHEKYRSTDVVVDGLTQLLGVLQQVGGISDVDESDDDRLDAVVDDLTQPTRSADFRTKPVLHLIEIIDENYVNGTAVNRGEHCPLYGFIKGCRFVNYICCKGTTDG